MAIGLYICQCNGEISRVVDTGKLATSSSRARGVTSIREHPCICSAEGIELIAKDLRDGTVDRVVIAGCSPRVHGETFVEGLGRAALNKHLIERCNLREQCAWPHAGDPEAAQRKARVLVAMSVARARYLEPLAPLSFPAVNRALVVGAGIAGLSAAMDLAAAGVDVMLAERQPYLGGHVVTFHRYFPRMCTPQCGVDYLVEKLRADPRVLIYTDTELRSISGSPGNFQVELVQKPRHVLAEKCTGCGQCVEVCPSSRPSPLDMGRGTTKAIHLPHPMAYPRSYVVDREFCQAGCAACAEVCPTGAVVLEEAEHQIDANVGAIVAATGWEPYDASAVEQYGHGRYANVLTNLEFERLAARNGPTGGRLLRPSDGQPVRRIGFIQCVGSRDEQHLPYCSQVCCAITLKQIAYVRESDPEAQISVFYMDMRAVGEYERMYRAAQEEHRALFVRGNPYEVVEDPKTRELILRVEDTLSGRQLEPRLDLVVLAVGMVPAAGVEPMASQIGQSQDEDGFASGHLQCFPYELRRNGIYAAGASQGPMDVSTAVRSAGGAAMKAMAVLGQSIEVSPAVPVVDKVKCDKCKRCMEECPVDAWFWDESGYPAPDLLKCRQCGICQGGCPMRVISLKNFSIKQIAGVVQAADPSFAGKGQPAVLAFLCSNDAYPAVDLAGRKRLSYPANVVTIPVPCAGSISVAWVTDALTNGIDGVLIAGCKSDQCHFFQGSDLAKTRLGNMQETLQRMLIEPERIRVVNLGIDDDAGFVQGLELFLSDLRRLGPSPFRA